MEELKKYIRNFFPFAKKRMGFEKPPKLFLKQDMANAENTLGKTAFYDPSKMSITLFVSGRHPKDVLRSFSHELVHHAQNCRGDFEGGMASEDGYAQSDPHMREMEREAYEQGNLCFRDWEDSIKYGGETMNLNETTLRKAIREALKKIVKEETLADNPEKAEEAEAAEEEAEKAGGQVGAVYKGSANEGVKSYNRDDDSKTGGNRYGGGGYLDYGEEDEELEEAIKGWGGNKGDKSKTHKGEKDYTTKKGEEVKTGKTKGEKAYEDPSKGEESKTHKGEEDYTTKKGEEKKGDEADIKEGEVEESVSHPADDREGNRAQGRRVKKTSTGERIEEDQNEVEMPVQEWYQHSLFDRLTERFTRD